MGRLCAIAKRCIHRGQESGFQRGVGIDDDDRIERVSFGLETILQPVERRSLAGVVGCEPFVDFPPMASHHGGGVVGAVVGDDVYVEQLARVVELVERLECHADTGSLVMGRDEDRESGRGGTMAGRP